MKIFKFLMMALIAILTVVLPACSKDDDPDGSDDGHKYEIVGVWKAHKVASSYTEDYVLDIKSNGTVSYTFTTTNKYDSNQIGSGTWSYNEGVWYLSVSPYEYGIGGSYIMVDDQLINEACKLTYTRSSGSTAEQEDPELVKLYGSWKGSIDSDSFVLTFTSDGKMSEKVNGKDMNSVGFTFKNGELTFSSGTVLENCMGTAPIVVQFASSAKSMTIWKKSDPSDKYTFTKQ